MNNHILEIQQLHKSYGKLKALQGLSLTIEKGNIYGLLGPNGSGKTTTLGIILGVINASQGKYLWFDKPPSYKIRKKIGAILETPSFYPYLSGYQNLKVTAKIKDIPETRIDEVLSSVQLTERKYDLYKHYSLGMKQRLAIAAALLPDPEVMILDEPTNGLDPQGIKEVRDIINSIGNTGKTIILASHLLVEVQRLCTHFAVLNRGKLIYEGNVNEVLEDTNVVEVASADLDALNVALSQLNYVESVNENHDYIDVYLYKNHSPDQLNQDLHRKGIVLSHLMRKKKNLESQFLEILSQAHD